MEINDLETKIEVLNEEAKEKLKNGDRAGAERKIINRLILTDQLKQKEGVLEEREEQKMMLENSSAMKDIMSQINKGVKDTCMGMDVENFGFDNTEINDFFKEYEYGEKNKEKVSDIINQLKEEIEESSSKPKKEKNKDNKDDKDDIKEELDLMQFLDGDPYVPPPKEEKKKEEKKEKEEKEETKKKEKEEEDLKLNLDKKDDIMIIINSQNFIEGFWDINNKTKIIKKKYENEFKLLKEKNIDDIVAMTIILVYFINKEHKELIEELVMILKKSKLYIQDKGGDSYENIIKKIGIV